MLKKINSALENLFDHNSGSGDDIVGSYQKAQNNFQIVHSNHGIENLSYIFTNEINSQNLPNLFFQLSSYFEIGFLMKRDAHSGKYYVQEGFVFSKKISAIEELKPVRLPASEIFKILHTKAHSFLNHFGMADLDKNKKMKSYLIPITSDYIITLASQTAEPWAKLKIESLQKTLMKINFSI